MLKNGGGRPLSLFINQYPDSSEYVEEAEQELERIEAEEEKVSPISKPQKSKAPTPKTAAFQSTH